MNRIGGYRRKTRSKLRKKVRTKGKMAIRSYLQAFKDGDKVYLVAEPSMQDGLYHLRFHARAGTIVGKQGSNYYVSIMDGDKRKKILVHPVHLKKNLK
ncbi:50S ribosomal protein L21e [Candidatus Woesearchaeota archaeon]|nr:50S ribosomal protein L21e [Candidatus Woesearchaeota archaeon]